MRYQKTILVLGIFLSIGSFGATTTTWNEKMVSLRATLSALIPLAANSKEFQDPKNRKRILEYTKNLKDLTHRLDKMKAVPSADPLIPLTASLFQEETRRIHEAVQDDSMSYARQIVLSMTSYCVSCHTRLPSSDLFQEISVNMGRANLGSVDRVSTWIAMRHFKEASDLIEKEVRNEAFARKQPFDWQKLVLMGLNVMLRHDHQPDRAMKLLRTASSVKHGSRFFSEDLRHWESALRKWKKDKKRIPKTPSGLIAEARMQIANAKKIQAFPADRSGEVHYLLASELLHRALSTPLPPKQTSEALLLVGVCYEALGDLNLGVLHELVYEACIRKAPKTSTAEECYLRYEESLYTGFSGSGGTALPNDVRKKLRDLKKIAIR